MREEIRSGLYVLLSRSACAGLNRAECSPEFLGRSIIRVWDAGCASGEEAYSVAMLLFENLWPFACDNLHIDATDIEENSQFANTIATGIYSTELLKGSPHQELLAKYSTPAARAGRCGVRRRAS